MSLAYLKGPSCRQSEGYPILETAPVLPTHGPLPQPTPVTILTLSLLFNLANAALALV
jgi:hypothetical protein